MWMSNSPVLLKELTLRCDGLHPHQHLTENRAKACENYPIDLVHAILRGIAKTMDARRAMHEMQETAWNVMLNLQINDPVNYSQPDDLPEIEPSTLYGDDGKTYPVTFDPKNFKTVYRDEYTGEVLPYHLVRAAMAEEMAYFNRVVWEATEHSTAKSTDDFKLVRTRWVITNKGDSESPDVRARLVACEINDGKTDAYFASTPPLEAKRILFSQYASRRWSDDGTPWCLSFVDIKKAYFNATPNGMSI